MKRLIFIHGRSQHDKIADELKGSWIATLKEGMDGDELPIDEQHIHFPYFGDTLRDLCNGLSPTEAAKIVVRGALDSAEDDAQLRQLLRAYYRGIGITEADIELELQAFDGSNVRERGPQNWGWVQAVIRAIDRKVPGAGSLIAMVTNDVHQYLTKDTVRISIERGVRSAFDQNEENIVVAHSLGTIVAYTLLRKLSKEEGWRVPTLITLGSPLGIASIRNHLEPITYPRCVGTWFNASDPNDVVALYPLTPVNFGVDPAIEDKRDVRNRTKNRHGITGYLNDRVVAKRIYDAIAP